MCNNVVSIEVTHVLGYVLKVAQQVVMHTSFNNINAYKTYHIVTTNVMYSKHHIIQTSGCKMSRLF